MCVGILKFLHKFPQLISHMSQQRHFSLLRNRSRPVAASRILATYNMVRNDPNTI